MAKTTARAITLHVNGSDHRIEADPETPLLYVLRNDLGLKSAKFGCGLGQCGTCRVLIDGEAALACQTPVGTAEGREITTLEGLGTPDALHPLQRAFIAENAAQCGYCTSGMIIAAKALLDRNPHPTDAEIRAAMAPNLCRCGTYDRVRRAIRRAAGEPVPPHPYEAQAAPPLEDGPADPGLPRPLQQYPEVDDWVRIEPDGTITLFTGKVELGQDIRTSVAMIGADELDVALDRIRVVTGDTARTPDEGYTVSSRSLETTGNAIRHAAAEVRQLALEVAYEELEAPIDRLTITDGTIRDPETGRSVTYWALFGGKRLGRRVGTAGRPKDPEAYRIVDRPAERFDILAKVTGEPHFVHDLALPGMVHGRVVRPPTYDAALVSVDTAPVEAMDGVLAVVRDGSFLGVVAEREEEAVRAMNALKDAAEWASDPDFPPYDALFAHLLSQPDQPTLVVDGRPVADPIPPVEEPAGAVRTLTATYERPYQMHASLGPSAAVARWDDDGLTVWSHSQGPYPLRRELAHVLKVPEARIRAIHMEGPGCYGHNGADDAALDAVLLARAVPGRPVSLQWMREDEHTWEPYGAATAIRMQASLDADGGLLDWNHDVWGYAHSTRARAAGTVSGLLAAWTLAEPMDRPQPRPIMAPEVGIHRNADPHYTVPNRRIVRHFQPDSPLRVSALRGLGYYANVFAIESFVDELAHAAGADPTAFRLRYLNDPRARAVIEAAAEKAGPKPAGGDGAGAVGRGLGFAQYKNRQSYVAVVVDLTVDPESGRIRLQRAVLAADSGQIVNPDGLSNQLEGGFLQAASWTLKEAVTFDDRGVTSTDWRSYPILRFPEAPIVETVLLDRPGYPFLGVGEGTHGPVPAAIANGVFDAVGIRLRRLPFTPARVREALA